MNCMLIYECVGLIGEILKAAAAIQTLLNKVKIDAGHGAVFYTGGI
jgi:hypothetical protein